MGEILQAADESASSFLAHLAIKGLIESAPGATNGARLANREHLATIVREGQRQGMKIQAVARLVEAESSVMQNRSVR